MNLAALIDRHDGDAIALIGGSDGRSHTYEALRHGAQAIRGGLLARDEDIQTVGIFGDASIAFVESVLGVLGAGAAVLPLHPRNPPAELRRAVERTKADLVIVTDPTDGGGRVVDAEMFGSLVVTAAEVANDQAPAPPIVEVESDAPAYLLFTSGTAGPPRPAVLTHANVIASIEQTIGHAEIFGPSVRTLGVLPLDHVLGLVSVLGVTIHRGSALVLVQDYATESVAQATASSGANLLVAPPVFWHRLAARPDLAEHFGSVEVALSGAAPLSGTIAAAIAKGFGMHLRQGYGLTEASPGVSSAIGTDAPSTSVGRPLPGVEVRLVDEYDNDALVGDVGEIWVRGPNVFAGYLDDSEATAAVIDDDGWLHTGDLAVVDERGHLFIVGRSKDQIIVAGFNVHPGDVEDQLRSHPDVVDAVVIGVADAEYGEAIVAHVVASADTIDINSLDSWCRSELAGYKCPSEYVVVDEIPRGFGGKVQRRVLRNKPPH